ncbi:sulfotransferase 1A3 [Diprion similis]|uniref:sulfotransferase 1A3 n=1 Tax=Diprion similis TaxID=362088 RepID=UPI001EF80643|nr:sulfotransferase 1A3 [Diprion similis]
MSREPPAYQRLDPKKTERMLSLFRGERTGWVQVGEKKWLFPQQYVEQGKHFYNFQARPSDTWVVSFPRSGTTWTQELVWLISNDLDFETARKVDLTTRFPFFELSLCAHPEVIEELVDAVKDDPVMVARCRQVAVPGYKFFKDAPSPRFIKSHFPFSLLPGLLDVGCKVLYVARNPKDVAVSWFHLNRLFKTQGYVGDFPAFWECFRNDLTTWSPYWEHLKEAWALRTHPNLLFLYYEDMNMDLPGTIVKVAKFLGKSLTREQILSLVDYLDFNSFRKNPSVNGTELKECGVIANTSFIRKGQTGGWMDTFTPELEADADEWIAKNLKDTDFAFPNLNNNNITSI